MTRTTQGLVIFALGAAAGVGFAYLGTNRKIVALQKAAADSTAAALQRDSAVTAFADSLQRRVDSLQKAKRPVTIKISRDSATAARADSALQAAWTTADSNVALTAANVALKDEIVGLRQNAHTDTLSLWAAMARGDALQDSLHAQTHVIVALNVQIQALNHHAMPEWFRIGFGLVEKGLAVKGLVDLARGR